MGICTSKHSAASPSRDIHQAVTASSRQDLDEGGATAESEPLTSLMSKNIQSVSSELVQRNRMEKQDDLNGETRVDEGEAARGQTLNRQTLCGAGECEAVVCWVYIS